ncbi:hypothetical protein LY76DRAFT_111819 [Colletotrichum caudatum]|nr:hypothetical protein LY76DRAFT_111819 [Colletotrichum caudatum]
MVCAQRQERLYEPVRDEMRYGDRTRCINQGQTPRLKIERCGLEQTITSHSHLSASSAHICLVLYATAHLKREGLAISLKRQVADEQMTSSEDYSASSSTTSSAFQALPRARCQAPPPAEARCPPRPLQCRQCTCIKLGTAAHQGDPARPFRRQPREKENQDPEASLRVPAPRLFGLVNMFATALDRGFPLTGAGVPAEASTAPSHPAICARLAK